MLPLIPYLSWSGDIKMAYKYCCQITHNCRYEDFKTHNNVVQELMLGEENYGPGSEPQWKAGGTRYLNLYKALLEEPSRTRRTKLLEDNSRDKTGDGRIARRPARAWIRNQ